MGVAAGVVIAPHVNPARLVPTVPAATAPPAATASATAEPTLESLPVGALPAAPPPSAPRSAKPEPELPVPSARGLGAERGLLDVARSAMARGEAAEALAAVDRHGRDYRDGALVEEREALGIKALLALGRRDEARARAARFEKRFPDSLPLRAVRGAVGTP